MRVSFSGLLDYSKGMIAKVLEYVKKYRMIEEGDTIAAGVSGGADSVCLLFVMLHLQKIIPFRLAVVHVNHGIRQEAGRDADYVRGLCEDKGLPFYLTEADVPGYAASCGMSSEEAGREIRYRALREALEREGAGVRGRIAVAHNGNDRAETMLFHLFRGTGLTQMHIPADAVLFSSHHKGDLTVGLKPYQPVDHMAPCFFQHLCPYDIVFLIKSCLQFHQNGNLLAVFRRLG